MNKVLPIDDESSTKLIGPERTNFRKCKVWMYTSKVMFNLKSFKMSIMWTKV